MIIFLSYQLSAQFQHNEKINEVAYEGHSFGDNLEPPLRSAVDTDLDSLLTPDVAVYLQGFMATAYSSLIAHMTDTYRGKMQAQVIQKATHT